MDVSVVIPAYNQGRYLREAIDSALLQRPAPLEVIVIDDGSTDETPAVCEAFGGRIRYVRQKNGGVSAARNLGVAMSRGAAILFLDSDDVLLPGVISRALHALASAPTGARIAGVHTDYQIFSEEGDYVQRVSVKSISRARLLRDSLLIPSGLVMSRDCVKALGEFDGSINTCEDWDYWLRAAIGGWQFLRVPVIGFLHREHGESASKRQASALVVRRRFLGKWRNDSRLSGEEQSIVRHEISRTAMRQWRAAYFVGEPRRSNFIIEALDACDEGLLDPWLIAYGSVYVAPFFRHHHGAAEREMAIRALGEEVHDALRAAGRDSPENATRVDSGVRLALGLECTLSSRPLDAASNLFAALRRNPRLALDTLRDKLGETSEAGRIAAISW